MKHNKIIEKLSSKEIVINNLLLKKKTTTLKNRLSKSVYSRPTFIF